MDGCFLIFNSNVNWQRSIFCFHAVLNEIEQWISIIVKTWSVVFIGFLFWVSDSSAKAFDMVLGFMCLEIHQNSVQTVICTETHSSGQAFCQKCGINGLNWRLVCSNSSSNAGACPAQLKIIKYMWGETCWTLKNLSIHYGCQQLLIQLPHKLAVLAVQ
jgi:hypothetical protein